MWKKWKESEFFKKMKQVRVNRAVYLSAIIILITLSVVLAITAATNRANKTPDPSLPDGDTTQNQPVENPDTDKTPGEDESKPTYDDLVPELALPVSAGTLTKKHSVDVQVFSQTMNDYRIHLGIDIATAEAAPVCAVAAGTVAQMWEDPMMGWCIAVEHKGDCVTVYKNLAKTFAEGITVGSEVQAGQLLGNVGESAWLEIAEEPHLHMEMTVKGLQVDPLEYFSAAVIATLTEDSIYESELGK